MAEFICMCGHFEQVHSLAKGCHWKEGCSCKAFTKAVASLDPQTKTMPAEGPGASDPLPLDPRSGDDRRAPSVDDPHPVNHPNHYGGDGTYEVVKVLEAWGLHDSFALANVIKYVARARKKGNLKKDLEKARLMDTPVNGSKIVPKIYPDTVRWVQTTCDKCDAHGLVVEVPLREDGTARATFMPSLCGRCYASKE